MLARRLTIVCLLLAIFGMALANLVAKRGHHTKLQARGTALPCWLHQRQHCG